MSSVIVFSKDRPMQLHAYLESLLLFSDIRQESIAVLYYEMGGIDYNRVKKEFPLVNWVAENAFQENLISLVEQASDFIMFGCDDVVFTAPFTFKEIEAVLQSEEQCFGFSLRLGKNIKPRPKNISKSRSYLKWNWETKRAHYNYPWELDSTVYRKTDVLQILTACKEPIANPNFLEENISKSPGTYISRPNLMCYRDQSKAFVITVNRVQDTHCNPFDDADQTDVQTLNTLYNEKNKTLDIQTIAKLKRKTIHVGAEYFKLK